ncbi:MAG: hypothetical protein ABW022_11460 [Actinoplanes sp.]
MTAIETYRPYDITPGGPVRPVPREVARRQPADVEPTPAAPPVVEPARKARPTGAVGVFGWFGLFLLTFLFAGFLLSMWQQAS